MNFKKFGKGAKLIGVAKDVKFINGELSMVITFNKFGNTLIDFMLEKPKTDTVPRRKKIITPKRDLKIKSESQKKRERVMRGLPVYGGKKIN